MKRLLQRLTHHPVDAAMLGDIVLALLAIAVFLTVVFATTGGK